MAGGVGEGAFIARPGVCLVVLPELRCGNLEYSEGRTLVPFVPELRDLDSFCLLESPRSALPSLESARYGRR